MGIKTRLATADDARAIAVAHTRAWQVAYAGIVPARVLDTIDVDGRTAQWHQNIIEEVLPNGTPSPTNLVADVDGAVVGFACVGVWRGAPNDDTTAELWAMYVHPDHWDTGAGYALMTSTMGLFAEWGVATAYLWVVDNNARARRFYERQGWQADTETMDDDFGGTMITERRYSIVLQNG